MNKIKTPFLIDEMDKVLQMSEKEIEEYCGKKGDFELGIRLALSPKFKKSPQLCLHQLVDKLKGTPKQGAALMHLILVFGTKIKNPPLAAHMPDAEDTAL